VVCLSREAVCISSLHVFDWCALCSETVRERGIVIVGPSCHLFFFVIVCCGWACGCASGHNGL